MLKSVQCSERCKGRSWHQWVVRLSQSFTPYLQCVYCFNTTSIPTNDEGNANWPIS